MSGKPQVCIEFIHVSKLVYYSAVSKMLKTLFNIVEAPLKKNC